MHLAATLRPLLLGALVLAACGDAGAGPAATTEPTVPPTVATTVPPPPTATTLAPTTTTLAPTTTGAPTTTTTSTTTTTTTTSSTTTPTAAGPPPTGALVHGGFAWAVYVGVWDEPPVPTAVDEAAAAARAAGYDVPGWSDGACDQGSAEALGVDPDAGHYVAAVYFATEADARGAADAIGEGVEAVAEVQTYCLD